MAGIRFDEASAVRRIGPGTYRAELDAEWGFGGNVNGGYLLVLLARAAMDHTGTAFPHSISASFLRPAGHGPVDLEVIPVRAGRTATHVMAVLSQQGQPSVHATLVLGATPHGEVEHPATAPVMPAEDDCVPLTGRPEIQGYLERLAISYEPGLGPHDLGDPIVRGWARLRSGEPTDALVGLLATDLMVPTVARIGYRAWAPTVQMTVQLHGVPAPGPLAVEVECGELRDGWFDEEARVFDVAGHLVARGRQLARLPR
ncbi:MAG TPA: thioesterase family protein [Sporichthyaceae bacterium]